MKEGNDNLLNNLKWVECALVYRAIKSPLLSMAVNNTVILRQLQLLILWLNPQLKEAVPTMMNTL